MKILKKAVKLICVGVSLIACTPSQSQTAIKQTELENGLKVLLRPLEGSQNTALVVLFSVGGDNDPAGRSGLAHLVEHVYVTAAGGATPARLGNCKIGPLTRTEDEE